MESKLAILKDAWNEFLLDETISNAAKGVVDLATSFLNLINKLNDLPGALGTASKALVAFGIFKGGKKIFDGLSAGISQGKEAARVGESFSESFFQGFKSGLKTKKITTNDFLNSLSLPTNEDFQKGFKETGKVKNLTQKISTIQNSPILMNNDKAVENLNRYQKELDELGVSAQQAYAQMTNAQILNNEQWDDAIKLTEQGISAENAVKIAKLEVTEAEALEALAAEGVTDATKSQIAAKREEILQSKLKTKATLSEVAALKTKAVAEKISSAADKVSNWSKSVQEKGGLFKGTKAVLSDQSTQIGEVIKNIKSGGKAIGSITSSIAAALGTTTAALVGTVTAVGLVTAAVVGGIIVWNKYFSLEARMANAQKAVEDASAAAEKAKTRYDDLLSAKDNYTGLQDTLENLVKGTEEWNKALIDSNNQVLELLNTYPTLAKYLSNDNGVLKISSEGWDEAVKQAQNSVTATTAGQLQAQSVVAKLNNEQIEKNIQLNGFWESLDYKNFAQQAVAQNNLTKLDPTSEKYQNLYNSLSQTYGQSNIDKAIENVRSLNAEIEKTNQEIQTYKDSIAQTLAEGAKVPKEFADNFAEQMQDEDAIKDEAKRLRTGRFSKTGAAEELQKRFGIQSTGDQEKDLVRLYQELSGESQEDVLAKFAKDGDINKVNDKQISKAIAQLTISDTTVKKVKRGYEELNKVYDKSSDEFKKFTGLMSDDGKELTSALAETYSNKNATKEFLEQTANKMGLDKKDFAELYGFDNFDEMAEKFTERAKTSNELLANSAQEINSILSGQDNNIFTESDDNYKSLIKDMYLGDQTVFNQRLVAIATEMGQTGVDKFLDVLSTTYGDLNERSQKILASMASTIDLEDIQTMDDFINVLEDLGINVQDLSDDTLEKLNGQIQALAATSKRTIIDLDKAESKLESLKSAKDIVEKAADNKTTTYSEEDFATLKSAGISMDDFFYNGETYQYLGNTVDLLKQIQIDTNSIRQKMYEQTVKDVEQGAKIADWVNNGNSKYSLTQNSDAVSSESLLNALIKGDTVYNAGGAALDKNEQDNLTKEVLEKLIGSVEFDKMGGDTMSGEFAQSLLKQIYESTYGIGGTEYQNNLSDYSNAIQTLSDPLAAQASASKNAKDMAAYDAELDALSKKNKLTEEEAVREKELRALYNSSSKALKAKAAALKIEDEELKDKTDTEKAAIIEEKQLAWNIEKTKEETEDLFDVLADDSGASDTQKDNALSEIVDAANRYLNLDLSKEFLKEGNNLKDFQKAISGTKEEFNSWLASLKQDDLKKALGFTFDNEGFIKAFTDAGIEIQDKKDEIQNALKENPITVDAETGKLDFTRLFLAIAAIVGSAKQALEVIKAVAGSEVSFDISYKSTAFNSEGEAEAAAKLFETGTIFKAGDKWYANIPQLKGKYSGSSVTNDYSPSIKSPSGDGGSSGSDKEYESDYDKYYNLLKKIERVQENRNKLQDEYSKMLDDEDESYGAIANKQSSILSNLKNEVDYQKQLAAGRLSQISQLQAENSDLTGYASYDQNLNKVQINYDAIKSVKDSDLGEKIDDYISDLETWADSYTDSQQTILELQQDIDDLIKAGTIDLDKSTNVLEQIEEIQNSITNIEAEREILLGNLNFSQEALSKSYEDQLTLLKQQVSAQAMLSDEREKQYQDSIKKTVGGNWTKFFVEVSKGRFEVNWDILSKENQTVIDEALERLEQVNKAGEAIQEATEQVNDAKKALQDFNQELKDKQMEFYDQVKDALVENYQQQIDKLTAINDSINKSNTNILSAISESIEKQRQERENEKTEQNLSDMQNQLAFLKMDTSGANQMQILELQKSIDEQTEDYTDTLIDQRISELEDQNSKAFEQRQAQIDLMQQHLKYIQETGEINKQVQKIIDEGITTDGQIKEDSTLANILKGTAEYLGMPEQDKADFWKEVKAAAVAYQAALENNKLGSEDSPYKKGEEVTDREEFADIKAVGGRAFIDDEGKVKFVMPNGTTFTRTDGFSDPNGGIKFGKDSSEYRTDLTGGDARKALKGAAKLENLTDEEKDRYDMNGDGAITVEDARQILRIAARLDSTWTLKDYQLALTDIEKGFTDEIYDLNGDGQITQEDVDLIPKMLGKPKKFKTGGLANFTGPAWLDGTASKPELVLNQRDTENFIQLKDILSSVLRNVNGQTATKTGDTYYEIHIEVDKLDSDYSVDDVANRVKQIIATDANYRNVNLINNLR